MVTRGKSESSIVTGYGEVKEDVDNTRISKILIKLTTKLLWEVVHQRNLFLDIFEISRLVNGDSWNMGKYSTIEFY